MRGAKRSKRCRGPIRRAAFDGRWLQAARPGLGLVGSIRRVTPTAAELAAHIASATRSHAIIANVLGGAR